MVPDFSFISSTKEFTKSFSEDFSNTENPYGWFIGKDGNGRECNYSNCNIIYKFSSSGGHRNSVNLNLVNSRDYTISIDLKKTAGDIGQPFGLIWGFALIGIIFKIWFYSIKMRKFSMWTYIAMGWLIIIAIVPVIKKMPDESLWFLLIGSISYCIGTFFYIKKNIPFGHSIFHLFILGGTICHFYAIYYILV